MNQKVREIFAGKVVPKDLARRWNLEEFPRYVLEYLIDSYCREESLEEDMARVSERLRDHYVYGAGAERVKSLVREEGRYPLIARLQARLDKEGQGYYAAVESLGERFIRIPAELAREYPLLLSGGMWGTITLGYAPELLQRGHPRPYEVLDFVPFQVVRFSLEDYRARRAHFSTEEWLDLLINTFGLNPEAYSRREKLLLIARAIPLVEANSNLIELGPRETGKTYTYRNLSYYAHTLSGERVSPASLFYNLATGQPGILASRDLIAFDEIVRTDFAEPRETLNLLQNYMQDGKFTRGLREHLGFSSLVFCGNLEVQGREPHEKYYHLFEELPSFMQEVAFLDRLHGYIPGWEIPKLTPASFSEDYGLVADYFGEVMHALRTVDLVEEHWPRVELLDGDLASPGLTGRDARAIRKNLSALLKLIYPHGVLADEELAEVLALACELRQRVREQLRVMAPGEYARVSLGGRIRATGRVVRSELREARRIQRVALPEAPAIGDVVGLGVYKRQGILLRFEVVANKGRGRVIPLGSIQRVMKESVDAAVAYIRSNAEGLGINPNFIEEQDISILATQMGIPKEGPSAGIAILVGLVSTLRSLPVRSDIALTGEITLHGRILGVGDIQEKMRVAFEAGVQEVFIPQENERELLFIPAHIRQVMKVTPVSRVEEVLERAFAV